MRAGRSLRFAVLAATALACGSSARDTRSGPIARPESTFGTPGLVALVPAKAEWVLELDLARLRANATIGETVGSFARATDARVRGELGLNPLLDADHAVIASFPGADGAGLLFLFRGPSLGGARPERPDLVVIDARTLAIGPEGPRAAARELASGRGASVLDDAAFAELRDASVPEGAPGASVRLTARLAFGRRVTLASQLDLETAPASISAWGDVADDLVLVVRADTERPAAARQLAESLAERAARSVRELAPGARLTAKAEGASVRVVIEVGPRALAELARTFVPPGPTAPATLAPRAGEEAAP